MVIIDYQKKDHKQIIRSCIKALKIGKVVAYPTDTSYGLAVDATNTAAVKKLYKIKERESTKPVHVIVPTVGFAKKIVRWNSIAQKLSKKFWPGPLTLVLPLKIKDKGLRMLSAGTGFMGIRYPKDYVALDLAKYLKKPITTTSANPPSGKGFDDNYDAIEVIAEFRRKKYAPDIIINAGKLPKRKPSTMVKVEGGQVTILREGPISERQIRKAL